MKICANAKINLMLDVVKKRDDGFHEVKMIMQTLDLCDIITAEKTDCGIELDGSDKNLPYGETNLAYRAADLFFTKAKISGGISLYIQKNIPICAGMAGGSSDAAAVLLAANELYGLPFDTKKLMELGAVLGSDVPYCIMKGTALAEGRGEILKPIAPFSADHIVVVKPNIGISTPWAYKSLKLNKMHHPNVDGAIDFIEAGDKASLYKILENVFEKVVFESYPEVSKIKDTMKSLGAAAALMSGSGPTIFGIFENEKTAKKAHSYFKQKYNQTFLTKTV